MNGEVGTIYVFSEAVSSDLMGVISSLSMGKTTDKWSHDYILNLDVIASKGRQSLS